MERVFFPFTLAPTRDLPAEAKVNFRVDRAQSQFNRITIAGLKFMKVYEQSKYGSVQRPFTEGWDKWATYLSDTRQDVSDGTDVRNDLEFGHARNPELRALDDLPHLIEIKLNMPSRGVDRTFVTVNEQQEYQSNNMNKKKFKNNNETIQSHLIYMTNMVRGEYGGWEGSIACNMSDLGFFDVRGKSLSNEFEISVKMFNYKGEQLSEIPGMEMNLLFR